MLTPHHVHFVRGHSRLASPSWRRFMAWSAIGWPASWCGEISKSEICEYVRANSSHYGWVSMPDPAVQVIPC